MLSNEIFFFYFSAYSMILSMKNNTHMAGCIGKIKAISIKNDLKADFYPQYEGVP
jgi:hypothetical protein